MTATTEVNKSSSISQAYANAPMSGLQIGVVVVSVLLNALDGFDVLSITFAAPGISEDWAISRSALGIVISASLGGMVAGSVLIAPFADRIGRRPTMLICLSLMTVGMFLTGVASSIGMLCVFRIITGLGIGGLIPTITAVAAEFSNERRRDFSVSAMTIGFPVGGLLGGLLSAELVDIGGWRSIFMAGGVITGLFIPIVWFVVPESLEYLAARGGPDAIGKINKVLARLGHAPVSTAQSEPPPKKSADPRELFSKKYRLLTFLLVTAYMLHLLSYYFYSGWLPKILTDSGYEVATAINAATIMNIGGVLGGIAVGWATPYIGLKRLAVGSMVGTSVMLAVFAISTGDIFTIRMAAFVLGVFMFGGIVGLYAFLARAFPARLRVTGCGFAIACGRGGSIAGPVLGGVLLDAGVSVETALVTVGVAAAIGAMFLSPIKLLPEE